MYSRLTQGYNCCIFAYGQTGAGKTYSVLGSVPDLTQDPYTPSRGILPRVLEQLFTSHSILSQDRSDDQQAHTITCSYLEIYNEQIFDLVLEGLGSCRRTNASTRSGKTPRRGCLWRD